MDELISKKSLYEKIREQEEQVRKLVLSTPKDSMNFISYNERLNAITEFKYMVFDEPVAYDVDAVVKELKKESYVAMCLNTECRYVNLDKAIEIVKKGCVK